MFPFSYLAPLHTLILNEEGVSCRDPEAMAVTHLSFPALRQGSPVPLGQLVEESRTPRASTAPHHLLTSGDSHPCVDSF